MKRRARVIRTTWLQLRAMLRKYPWADYIIAFILIVWALGVGVYALGFISREDFGILHHNIYRLSVVSFIAGVCQAISAKMVTQKFRIVSAFLGLWALISLTIAVGSFTSKLAFGAWAFDEFLICAAVVL